MGLMITFSFFWVNIYNKLHCFSRDLVVFLTFLTLRSRKKTSGIDLEDIALGIYSRCQN